MKKLTLASFLSIALVISGCGEKGKPGARSSARLAKEVLAGLVNNDKQSFSDFVFDQGDMIHYYEQKLKHLKRKQNISAQDLAGTTKVLQRVKADKCYARYRGRFYRILESFSHVRRKAQKAGVSWVNARFDSVDYGNFREKYGMKMSDLYLHFFSQGKKWKIKIKDAIKTDRGWVLKGKIKWKGRYKEMANPLDN